MQVAHCLATLGDDYVRNMHIMIKLSPLIVDWILLMVMGDMLLMETQSWFHLDGLEWIWMNMAITISNLNLKIRT